MVTIDTQNDFSLPLAVAEVPGTFEVLPRMEQLLTVYRAQAMPIIHVVRLYPEDRSNVDLCRREAIEKGHQIVAPDTEGAELVPLIRSHNYNGMDSKRLLNGEFQLVGDQEWIMYKPRWGAFYNTSLEQFLRERGIDTILFIGCNFPNCPRTSIYEASERDFRTVMIADAMSQVYEQGMEEMRNIGSMYAVWLMR
ncbi:isochorismatase family cysteine hydrolase [Paenibacillus sp. D2_2]|uniref:cysteine hydrolase family protein n=1 Tax=Paenibacillus sp. D2_2 TaxID=3073092 RepID=UPI002814BF41|nr:isochorismatase family cysteine hydrolase [Paenibacillus sp. D2_2]WMT42485.1 isochorismatase family cysteine hydrolase [Paenibacillus sp. D2_2]